MPHPPWTALRARSRRFRCRLQVVHDNLVFNALAVNRYFNFIYCLRLSVIKLIVRHGFDNTHSTISSSSGHQPPSTMRDESKSASIEAAQRGIARPHIVIGLIGLGHVHLQLM